MDEQEILNRWVSSNSGFSQVEVWNEAAAGYASQPLPTFEMDPFLQFMAHDIGLCNGAATEMSVLDIGCGAGGYSLALAPYVKHVVGCDLSPNMIEAANQRAHVRGVTNATFVCADFIDFANRISSETSLLPELDRGHFDIVFAHFTPALSSGTAFQKMMSLAKSWCFVAMPTRRTDFVLEEARKRVGVAPKSSTRDENCLYTYTLAWLAGKTPRVEHYDDVWIDQRNLFDAGEIYANHLVAKDLSPEQKACVKSYLSSIAQEGIVYERIETTIVMMGWHM